MHLTLQRWESPVSTLFLVSDENRALRALEFGDRESRMHRLLREHYGHYTLHTGVVPTAITEKLHAYFDGDLEAPSDIATATAGTPFQRDVWRALREIPAGTTTSYGQLATDLGDSTASRAVGAANGANPIGIVVPCHRVIGADGSLTGYAGGLPRKQWLLEHEGRFASVAAGASHPVYLL